MKRIYLFLIAAAFVACEERNTPTPGGSGQGGIVTPEPTTPTEPVTPPKPEEPVIAYADFTYTIEKPLTVIITPKHTGRYVVYNWGDDNKSKKYSVSEKVTYRYSQIGEYTIRADVYGDNGSTDNYSLSIILTTPKVYIDGIRYLSIEEDGEYYKATLKDDDFFTTTWFTTNYTPVLNNSRLPYEYVFKNPVLMDGLDQDSYYTLYVYHSKNTSSSSIQCLKQDIYTYKFKLYQDAIQVLNSTGKTNVQLMMHYE